MLKRILSKTEKEITRADMAVILDYNDVAAATSGAANAAISVEAGTKVQCVGYRLITAFDRSGTGALTISVGDGGSATALLSSTVIAADGTEVYYSAGGSAKVYQVDDTVDVFFTDAGGMSYTSGKIVLYFAVENINRWPVA